MTDSLPVWRSLLYVPAHVDRFVLVADDPQAQLAALPDYEMAPRQPVPNRVIPIVVLERKA